jgi:hypothetical protein
MSIQDNFNNMVTSGSAPLFQFFSMACLFGIIFAFLSYCVLQEKLESVGNLGKLKVIGIWVWWWLPWIGAFASIPFQTVATAYLAAIGFPWFFLQAAIIVHEIGA